MFIKQDTVCGLCVCVCVCVCMCTYVYKCMHTSYAWLTISQPWYYLPECSVLLVLLPLCSLQNAPKADKSTKQINGVEGSKMQNKTFLHNFTDSFPQVYKIKFLPQKQYLKQVDPQDTHGLAVLFNLYWTCVMTHTHTHTVQLVMCHSSISLRQVPKLSQLAAPLKCFMNFTPPPPK
jgi:hypothetical protein